MLWGAWGRLGAGTEAGACEGEDEDGWSDLEIEDDRTSAPDDDASADGGHAPTGGSDENRRRIARELEKLPR